MTQTKYAMQDAVQELDSEQSIHQSLYYELQMSLLYLQTAIMSSLIKINGNLILFIQLIVPNASRIPLLTEISWCEIALTLFDFLPCYCLGTLLSLHTYN